MTGAPTVSNFLHKIDYQIHNAIANTAVQHPHAARLMSIAAAISLIVEHIFVMPTSCIEHVVRAGISVKNYNVETQNKDRYYDMFTRHLKEAAGNILYMPVAPFFGLVQAAFYLKTMFESPLKTAKIHAAFVKYKIFLMESNVEGVQVAFAQAAFTRFRTQISNAQDQEGIAALHFLESPQAVKQLEEEVQQKEVLFRDQYRNYMRALNGHFPPDAVTEAVTRAWTAFERNFIIAEIGQARTLIFNPPSV